MVQRISDASQFVKRLDLPKRSALSQSTQKDKRAGAVVAGSALSFVAGVDKQMQEDCINSTLLAQLAASHQVDRMTDIANWYIFYQNVLNNIGWDAHDFVFEPFIVDGDSFTLDQAILQLIQALGNADEVSALTALIAALKSLARDDPRLVIWESNTHIDQAGNLQIGSVTVSDGFPIMNLMAFNFAASQTVDQLLFYTFAKSTEKLFQTGQTMNLDPGVYSQVRQSIKQKLGKKAVELVGNVDISGL